MTRPDYDEAAMERRTARLAKLRPTKENFDSSSVGIPREAYEVLAARNIYFLMAPEGVARGGTSRPAVTGQPGVEVSIVDCPPGNGAALHIHEHTWETFMPLTGRYEILWGDAGEHRSVLEPFDLLAVPAGIYRAFRNIEDHDARMLVIIQGGDAVMSDLTFQHSVGQAIAQAHGSTVRDNFGRIGIAFAPAADPVATEAVSDAH